MASSRAQKKAPILPQQHPILAEDGGIEDTQRYLRFLQDDHPACHTDPVLVFIHTRDVTPRSWFKILKTDEIPIRMRFSMTFCDTRKLHHCTGPNAELYSSGSWSFEFLDVRVNRVLYGKQRLEAALLIKREGEDYYKERFARSMRVKMRIPDEERPGQLRNLVLVGRDIAFDVNIFRFLGINLEDIGPLVGAIDTTRMSKYLLSHEGHIFGNGAILRFLDINVRRIGPVSDAMATFIAFLAMARHHARKRTLKRTESAALSRIEASRLQFFVVPRREDRRVCIEDPALDGTSDTGPARKGLFAGCKDTIKSGANILRKTFCEKSRQRQINEGGPRRERRGSIDSVYPQ